MRKIVLILLASQWAFSQSRTSDLEQKIYNSVDILVANPSEKALMKLELEEKDFRAKSKAELLALVILNCNKAFYQNRFGQTQNAINSYEKAWQLFQKNQLSNYDITESCLKPLGNLYTIIGDYENAENVIKHYYFIANKENNEPQQYAAILNLSNVYQNTGRLNEAIILLEKILHSKKLDHIQKGSLLNNLGVDYLLQSNYSEAKKAFLNSIKFLESKPPLESEILSNTYRNLSKIYAQENKYQQANLYMEESKNLLLIFPKNEPRKMAQLYYDLAAHYFQQKIYAEAQENIEAVFDVLIPDYANTGNFLPAENSLYAETLLLDALDLQAALYIAQNQPEKALESYRLSFHVEELLQSLLVYENSKIITQIRNRNRTEKCIEIYHSLYLKEKKISYIESAFLLSEQTKSAVLKQALTNSRTNSRTEKLILKQLQDWNTVIVKEQQKVESADISKINEAIKKQNELMLLLKSEQKKTSKTAEKEFKITGLYSKLKTDKAVLVEYFSGAGKLYVFTVQNGTIDLQVIPEKFDTNSIIRAYLSFFKDANAIVNKPKEYNRLAHTVYNFLRLPKKSSNHNLIIIPDGSLAFLPFESLITQRSYSTQFDKMHYLLNEFKIGYSNSAGFYLNAAPFQHKKENVLGIFPVFENTDFELAFSKKELENLEKNFEGSYFVNQNATFENFKSNAGNYAILHLSTHASSGDIIEPASIKFYDTEVLYSEFYHLDLKPDLVVLSACETGIGKLYKAEGAMSVARGFQFAGAQNLLFSLWKVNDFTTSVLMGKFYGNLKKGNSYFDSNHQAKLDFLADESIPNAKKSPYYWSSFVYYGSLENPAKTNYFLWIWLLGGLIALLLLWKIFPGKK